MVEDQISSLKVSRKFPSVALLGTALNHYKLKELLSFGNPLVLALDSDAYNKAIIQLEQFKFFLDKKCRVVQLGKDLKYETDSAIADIIGKAMET